MSVSSATSQRDQFLMKLRPEYEPVHASLVNRDPVPSLDACFGELLREEQRLHTQTIIKQTRVAPVAYVAYSKGKGHDMSKTQCYSCKKYAILHLIVQISFATIANSQDTLLRNVLYVLHASTKYITLLLPLLVLLLHKLLLAHLSHSLQQIY